MINIQINMTQEDKTFRLETLEVKSRSIRYSSKVLEAPGCQILSLNTAAEDLDFEALGCHFQVWEHWQVSHCLISRWFLSKKSWK